MKKIILGMVFLTLLSSLLYADNQNEFDDLFSTDNMKEFDGLFNTDIGDSTKKYEEKRRDSLSPEERKVEDLEKENRLKQRQRDAQREKERLDEEKRS